MNLSEAIQLVSEFNGAAIRGDSLDELHLIWRKLGMIHSKISVSGNMDLETFSITVVGWNPSITVLTGDEGTLINSAIVSTARAIKELTR